MVIGFKNKIVVITGASSGIGLVTMQMLVKEGAKIVVIDINPVAQTIEDAFAGQVVFFLCDVSDHNAVKDVFEKIRLEFGRMDILINNAGIQSYGSVTETTEAEWDRTIGVNLKGMFLCSKYAIPLLLAQQNPVIVNVASVKSFVSQHNEAAYVTSKAGVIGLTHSIAVDFAPRLRCVAVCPGAVLTPLLLNEFEKQTNKADVIRQTENIHLLKRIATPDEIANFILFLASDKASFATGHAYRIDGGIGIQIDGM